MDFDVLILAHSTFKRRFHEHLRGKHELDVETVRQVTLCNMGRWLIGEGQKYKDLPEYQALVVKHARFHDMAADVLERAATLAENEALKLVGPDTDFERASRECVAAISKMGDRVGQA
jgi:methyl-accepting chemotaxis protein